MMLKRAVTLLFVIVFTGTAFGAGPASNPGDSPADHDLPTEVGVPPALLVDKYATVRLEADLSGLSFLQRQTLPLLIKASAIMDELFWQQAYGDPDLLLESIENQDLRRFAGINYGPWDRLDGDAPFIAGVGPKPAGARFYPADMTREEFEAAALPEKRDWYTLLRRGLDGNLVTIPYHQAYAQKLTVAARLLAEAADLTDEPGFRRYLSLRARALITDDYQPSDMAWLDMKDNSLDLVIGPIEQYEDQLFGYKTAYSAYVLLKDLAWSQQLSRFAALLPALQQSLPVAPLYKADTPGTDSDLNAYDVLYYAGHSNAGSKTIAINLPNDEAVQLAKGTRRLQLKNAMRAKFDKILLPISGLMIAEDQQDNVTFDAFFATTMFHEVAHGLGPKNTVTGRGTVREALLDRHSAMEEGKADILGLYMITWLHKQGELPDTDLMDYYVTFAATTFRSIRFGASSAHAKSDMVRFNFMRAFDAIVRDPVSGRYRVDMQRMREAMDSLSAQLLTLQGNGDYQGAARLIDDMGFIGPQLAEDLAALETAGIPVDIVFEQGVEVLEPF
ncbi:MAG: Zn-dependent hydrolase [Gammaproteobacteria bacterium]